ncbi:MAG TPA: hypothetical protein VFF30_04580 [Nitrososphaerales archaeon]|nr:hypothetical protein [Nitrososphaerales archaeon]
MALPSAFNQRLDSKHKLAGRTDAAVSEIALKNLELAQARILLHAELNANSARVIDQVRAASLGSVRSSSWEASSSLVRACLFYETAIELAFSVFEISLEIVDASDKRVDCNKMPDLESGRTQRESGLRISRSEIAEFLEENISSFSRLLLWRNNILLELSEIRSSIDTRDAERARPQLFKTILEMEDKVNEACALVQAFLKVMQTKM